MISKLAFAAMMLSCILIANAGPLDGVDTPTKAEEQPAGTAAGEAAEAGGKAGEEKIWFPFPASFSAMFPGSSPTTTPPPPPPVPPPVIFINPPPSPPPSSSGGGASAGGSSGGSQGQAQASATASGK